MLSVRTRSIFGWLIGAGLGAIAGALSYRYNKHQKFKSSWTSTLGTALVGAGLVGMINDKRLESDPNYTGTR